ncbi:acyl-CoA dehydrogenase family protein [Granulicoccus phenolivorans]|uniref:acyl-CoA dehydrogenase family protein n=1 Tax=Granulicoccus phenolivorans TaxID=266854 RepID=UPI000409FF1C|nr:acyl-CoA dehydrogenase family protein [Granulicoccus phenolivorans]
MTQTSQRRGTPAQSAAPPQSPARPAGSSIFGPVDLVDLDRLFSAEEKAITLRVRALVDEVIRPNIADWYERAVFPTEIVPEFGRLGLLGMYLSGYGCPGRSCVEYGLAAQELEAGDSGLRTFVSVQGSLAMAAIYKHGSAEQKQEWLPRMAAGEAVGCFGLTEPTAGSDPSSMRTVATQEPGGDWILNGSKRWIGLATLASVAIIWAQTGEPGDGRGVRGFVVPTDTPGFRAEAITRKLSMRASVQCEITLDNVRLPADAILPADSAAGLKGAFQCLNEARYGIIWGVLGAARDSFDTVLDYTGNRTQFGAPLSSYQITQTKLADMAVAINRGYLLAHQIGRLKDADPAALTPSMISAGKLDNCRIAIGIARDAREMLGGNGISLDHSPLRHANNLESVRTYEGTDEVHQLTIGRHLTGHGAFGHTGS